MDSPKCILSLPGPLIAGVQAVLYSLVVDHPGNTTCDSPSAVVHLPVSSDKCFAMMLLSSG
jgi:hypothetical protein